MKDETDFRKLVRDMRRCQKMYFKTRDRGFLIESKNLEKLVDAELDEPKPEIAEPELG